MRLVRLALLAAWTAAAAAQNPAPNPAAPTHVTGVIVSYAAPVLTVKTAGGATVSVTLAAGARVIANQRSAFNAIKPNDFVATTVSAGRDGKLNAREVRIFPEAMRGLGEGRYPGERAEQSRINATVSEAITTVRNRGGTLKLSYHGAITGPDGTCSGHASGPGRGACTGEVEVVVMPSTPVLQWLAGDASWLEPGKAVSLYAVTGPDGKLSTYGVVVERGGVRPLP